MESVSCCGSWIELRSIRCQTRLGISPRERAQSQEIAVDVRFRIDVSAAAETDDLKQTVDYAALTAQIQEATEAEPIRLLERLASRLCDLVLENDSRIELVSVRVRKFPADLRGEIDSVSVEMSRAR